MEKLTLVFTQEELQVVAKALRNLPYGEVFGLFDNLQKQLDAQTNKNENKNTPTVNA